MGKICILTDSTAQFPQLGFAGRNDIRVIPFDVEVYGQVYAEGKDLRAADLPSTAHDPLLPRLHTPSIETFQDLFTNLGMHYSDVVAIFTSACLSPAFDHAQKAAERVRGRANISLINSQTTSVGLGLLVQAAAEAAAEEKTPQEIEHMIRSLIPHTYMMICTPGMSYLYHSGFLDQAQAFVGEMLGIMPIFTLEEGQLSAVEKVRNSRGLVDYMQEFVLEFDNVHHISFIQSAPSVTHEARLMREHVQNCFPQTPFSELTISLPLATLLGPRSLGLVVVEKNNTRDAW